MQIKLWYSRGACSLAARILLNEIEAVFESVEVPVATGATLSREFARINPKQRVPVMALDGEIITELPAVMTAIASLKPERRLFGKSPMETVRVYEWLNWLSGTVHTQGFGGLWRPARYSDEASAHPGIREKGLKTIQECFLTIEGKLDGSYAVGQDFTAVDPFLLVICFWGGQIGLDLPGEFPRCARFVEMLSARASVARALADER